MSAADTYIANAERLGAIIPTFDPANGDMIIVVGVEETERSRSFRLSPELGAQFRQLIFQAMREKAN
jgi:hypothetical protein